MGNRKKTLAIVLLIIFGILGTIFFLRLLTPEDTWICVQGQWQKHGSPTKSAPPGSCLK